MRCWVGSPWPAGLGLERARSKEVSSFAVMPETAGIRLKKVKICWSFRAVFSPVCRFAGS